MKSNMNQTIALAMIVKNESALLRRCLESAIKYVDEIVIVDTGSVDDTKDIAIEYGARLYDFIWENDFSEARNFSLSLVTSPWCLVLDADEYISNECGESIRYFISSPPSIGKIKRIDHFYGKDGINYEQSYISRLFPSYCRYSGRIHEQIESDLPRLLVDVEIQHDGYLGKGKSDRNIPVLKSMILEKPMDPYYYYQLAKEYRGLEKHELSYTFFKQAYQLMTKTEGYAPSLIVNYLYAIIASGNLSDGLTVIDKERGFLWNYPDFFFVSGLYLLELIMSNPVQYDNLIPLIERYYKRAIEIGDNGEEGSVVGTGSFAAYYNLGVFYEATGNSKKAEDVYLLAAQMKYSPAIGRLNQIKK